jgi:outer membrane protein TolC
MKIFILLILFINLYSQSLSLENAYIQAIENFKFSKNKNIVESIGTNQQSNLNINYYPQFNILAQLTHQSDVTTVSLPSQLNFAVPAPDKTQYKAVAEIKQVIFDGTITSLLKDLQKLNTNLETEKIILDILKLKQSVNQLFFGILLNEENLKITQSIKTDLYNRWQKALSAVKNGAILLSQANSLEAEYLKLKQRETDLLFNKKSLDKNFKTLLGLNFSLELVLDKSELKKNGINNLELRPELKLFDLQVNSISTSKELSFAKTLPKISGFFQFGYGKPALNAFKNDAGDFYITGINLNWNLFNWGYSSNEIENADLAINKINIERNNLKKQLETQVNQQEIEIEKLISLIEDDKQIIILRKQIKDNASFQLDQGIITSNEYITEVNQEAQALLTKSSHEIQLQLTQAILNNLNSF